MTLIALVLLLALGLALLAFWQHRQIATSRAEVKRLALENKIRADIIVSQGRLTCEPYREKLADMPESDLIEEGGLWESREQFIEIFGGPDLMPVVIRFEFTPLNGSSDRPKNKRQ